MKNHIILFVFICLAFLHINAQTKTSLQEYKQSDSLSHFNLCVTPLPPAEWDVWFNKKVEEFKLAKASGKAKSTNYTIPVVFHIIHGGQAVGNYPNLIQARINAQLAVLNQDFSGTGYNVGNLPSVFANDISNTGISFCLAQKDTNGVTLAEPGIDRINFNNKGWNDPTIYYTSASFMKYMDEIVKPNSIWDPTKYFNVWVTDTYPNFGLLGFATFPAGSMLSGIGNSYLGNATTDGVWCFAKTIGSSSIYAFGGYHPTKDKGRVLVHETGHWLGLRHISGDSQCGDDFCNDTPTQAGMFNGLNFSCPTHPLIAPGECAGTTAEMFMNFMDYTDDDCQYMFTNDQATRMQTAMLNSVYRNQLSANGVTLCTIPAIAPTASFSSPNQVCINMPINILNLTIATPVPSYSWSATPPIGVTFGNNTITPTINFTTPGIYTISVIATNSLGTSSNTQTINVINNCITTNFSLQPTSCSNNQIGINNLTTGSVTTSYSWTASPSVGVTFSPSSTYSAPSVNFSGSGNYSITLSVPNSFGITSKTKTITINHCATNCLDTITNIYDGGAISEYYSSFVKYSFGNNIFGDREFAEYFNSSLYNSIATPKIKSIIVLFYKNGSNGTGGNSANPVTLKVYNGTMLGGPVSTLSPIGQVSTTMGNILSVTATNSINYFGSPSITYSAPIILPYRFVFSTPINAPTSNGFFASVVTPTAIGDTIAVFASTVNTGSSWFLTTYNWLNVPFYKGLDGSLAILPEIDCGNTTHINNNSILGLNVSLHPNPSNGLVTLVTTLPTTQDLEVNIYNTLGQVIKSIKYDQVSNGIFDIDLTNLSTGVYIVNLNNKEEKIVKRLVLSK